MEPIQPMKVQLDPTSGLHFASYASTLMEDALLPVPPGLDDPMAVSCSPTLLDAEVFPNMHSDEVSTVYVSPAPSIASDNSVSDGSFFDLTDEMLSNLAPSNIPPTQLSKNVYGNEPLKFSNTYPDDYPWKNARGKTRPMNSEPVKFTDKASDKTFNDLVPLQDRPKITAQGAISMGKAAKRILASRTTVNPPRNVDKTFWGSLDKKTMAKLQSKNLHPLIFEKLQAAAMLANGATCA